jgi:predicted transglutaminase-like cysteine proteinase
MPAIIDRICHIARQGLFATWSMVCAVVLAAALCAGFALGWGAPDARALVLESYPGVDAGQLRPAPAQVPAAQTAPAAQASQAAPAAPAGPIRLFGTVEFRSSIENLARWERVRDSEIRRPTFTLQGLDLNTYSPGVNQRWLALRDRLQNATLEEKAREVNNFFNQWPYITDIENYGLDDYWATPREFIERSGDCEDYAITKYYALRDLGVPAELLRVAAVRDLIRGIGHAVLIVYMDADAYVLDNVANLILPHRRLTHYELVFTVNENFLWRHVIPRASTSRN